MSGTIRIVWGKTLWLGFHLLCSLIAVVFFFDISAMIVFVVLSGVTVLAGHSVGMHRLLIHRSFDCLKPLEYVLVWLGTLVGMAGPFGMIRAHDMRDWHQRQALCPLHPSHGAGFWKDAWWQLCCDYRLTHPPDFRLEEEVARDPIYGFMEWTWMAQQIPLAVVLFALGGWAWVLWGISLRISVSLIGHWAVGHFAHKAGHQDWRVEGVSVQGFNLPWLSLITAGENWHGNHHVFPHSAKLGVVKGQADPGFWFIRSLQMTGLAWNVQLPESQPERDGLVLVARSDLKPSEIEKLGI